MATSKQVYQVKIGAYVYKLGGYLPYTGQPADIDCWNIDISYEPDFLGDVSQQALTGYERGGTMGWRAIANVDLNNTRPAEATKILTLLNLMQSQFNRLFYPDAASVSVVAGTVSLENRTVVITGGVQTDNYYTGLDVYNITQGETRRIIDYIGADRRAFLDDSITGWQSGIDLIQVYVPPAYPTIIGLSPDTNGSNLEYYNIQGGSSFGITREFTVGTQSINIQLRGVERKQTIPDNVRIDT